MVRFPTMRPRQAAIIWAATALIVGMTIYPPWACVETRGLRSATGYHWFFTHPEGICLAANLDYPRLLIQWAVASLVAAALYFAWPPPVSFSGAPERSRACSVWRSSLALPGSFMASAKSYSHG